VAGTGGRAGSGGAAGTSARGGSSGGAAGASVGGAGGATSCAGAAYDAAHPPAALALTGNLGTHDPAMIVSAGRFYEFQTGPRLPTKTSSDLRSWAAGAAVFSTNPAWIATQVPGAGDLWAPDISFFGGQFHLYYAASTFGSNRSCIGHATRTTLDSGSWTDHGSVVCSNAGSAKDDWNAIDPNVVVDDAGTPWLVFGSFWSGIKAVKLDASGKRADTMLYAIANHSSGGIEGAWVFKRCGYYYLFVSWGACCSGAYDYNIRVGRSTSVTGPYVDKAGAQMMSGGGTLLVQGNASWVAPGHNAVITYNGKTYNLYHALQGSSSGQATLRIAELVWDADGWPVSGGP
jgi:arabinan endo-1,5-alpha-L-arabinosidase